MHWVKVALGACVIIGHTLPVAGQDRSFVSGSAGATVNQASGGVVQVSAGRQAGQRLAIVGEFAYLRNALPDTVGATADQVARGFERFNAVALGRQVSVDVDAAAPIALGTLGVRLVPWEGRVRPFIQVDGGVARINPRVRFLTDGQDISQSIAPPLEGAESKPAFGVGGGVDAALTPRIGIEARYRFTRIFADKAFEIYRVQGFNVNALTAGVRWEF